MANKLVVCGKQYDCGCGVGFLETVSGKAAAQFGAELRMPTKADPFIPFAVYGTETEIPAGIFLYGVGDNATISYYRIPMLTDMENPKEAEYAANFLKRLQEGVNPEILDEIAKNLRDKPHTELLILRKPNEDASIAVARKKDLRREECGVAYINPMSVFVVEGSRASGIAQEIIHNLVDRHQRGAETKQKIPTDSSEDEVWEIINGLYQLKTNNAPVGGR